MSDLWLTADLHLGHDKVARLRGFTDTRDHDRTILDNLTRNLGPEDSLWVLGDLSVGGTAAQHRALDLLRTHLPGMDGRLHLIAGNHDGVHPMHRTAHKWHEPYHRVFATCQPFARRKIAGHAVWLSHFPWLGGGDHTEDERHQVVRLHDDGTSWLIHGHTHSAERVDYERRQIHVGLDAWALQPVPLLALTPIFKELP